MEVGKVSQLDMGFGKKLEKPKMGLENLGKRKVKAMCLEGRRGGGQELHLALELEGIYLESQGRIPIDCASAFQVYPFRVIVSADWSVPRVSLVWAAGPAVSHGVTCLVLLLFLAWN